MTRKEELEARARDYVSLFVMSGAEPAAINNLAWMLMEVERVPTTGAKMMTRDEFEATLTQARQFGGFGLDPYFRELLAHDAEQRAEIARLRAALKDAMNLIDVDNLTTQTVYRNCQYALKETTK